MKYGVLGTGMVGQALAGKLVALGHDVMIHLKVSTQASIL
jgi:predicted dinucleotide-binding enzyme